MRILPCLLALFVLTAPVFGQSAPDCMHSKWFPARAKAVDGVVDDVPGGHDGYDVLAYDLALTVAPPSTSIIAAATVELVATTALSVVDFDLVGYSIAEVRVNGAIADYSRTSEMLRVFPGFALPAGATATVRVDYFGTAQRGDWFGLEVGVRFESDSVFLGGEPVGSRYLYPCNDRPDDKARFRTTTTMPEGFLVSGPGVLAASRTQNGQTTMTWTTDHQVTTYALPWAVGRYATEELDAGGLPILNYAFPSRADDAFFDFGRTSQMLDLYAGQFGPYPWEKYGHALIRGNLILETQTMTTFAQHAITGTRKHEPTVAHELAHQWWGNSVTPAEWNDIWLNEGAASFAEVLWIESTAPRDAPVYLERFVEEYFNFEHVYDVAVGRPGGRFLFAPVVYKKGAWVFHMLRDRVGAETFLAAWSDYAEANREGLGTTAKLREAFEQASGQDLSAFFDYWVYDIGLPEFDVRWSAAPLPGGMWFTHGTVTQATEQDPVRRDVLELRFAAPGMTHDATVELASGFARWTLALPFAPEDVIVDPRDVFLDISSSRDIRKREYIFTPSGPLAIIADTTTEVSVEVDGDFAIGDVDVALDIFFSHTMFLSATLVAPDGSEVELFHGAVGPYGAGTAIQGMVLTDEAPRAISESFPPFRGARRAANPLSPLDGKSSRGTWTLRLVPLAPGHAGSLEHAELRLLPSPSGQTPTTDLDADGDTDWLDLFLFAQWWRQSSH